MPPLLSSMVSKNVDHRNFSLILLNTLLSISQHADIALNLSWQINILTHTRVLIKLKCVNHPISQYHPWESICYALTVVKYSSKDSRVTHFHACQ